MIILIFFSINIISSMGTSLGLEIMGARIESFVQPEVEVSTNTRVAKLTPIWHMIKENPIFGNGIGANISYLNPYTNTQMTTRHFDWGYLEMWAELGILGSLILIGLVLLILYELNKKIRSISDFHDFYVGLFAGIISLLIINITSPALFHIFGIFYLVFVMAFVSKGVGIFDEVLGLLYRVFNRKH